MTKFLIRNDDVAADTKLAEIRQFCDIADKHGFKVLQAIMPIGEAKKIKSKMTNDQIGSISNRLFSQNLEVVNYLLSRPDLIGVHGLWHTHVPSEEEIKAAKLMLEELGFKPIYFVPPFNEGDYPEEIAGLKTCSLSDKKGERLEDFLDQGVPTAEIMYLHSWRFDSDWYTFKQLDVCLARIANHYA